MELETIGVGLGGTSLVSILIAWGVIKSQVGTLWKMLPDIQVTCTKVNIMWECWFEPAVKQGFVVRGMSLHLTDKGRNLLSPEMRHEIDSLLARKDILNGADPCVSVLNHLSGRLRDFAREKEQEVGIVFGIAQAYIEEELQAMPKPSITKKSLFRRGK